MHAYRNMYRIKDPAFKKETEQNTSFFYIFFFAPLKELSQWQGRESDPSYACSKMNFKYVKTGRE